jgi:hypothetical protein
MEKAALIGGDVAGVAQMMLCNFHNVSHFKLCAKAIVMRHEQ